MIVPAYLGDTITSFEDLKDPEVAAMFDKDGNGKGEYWAGDAAWKSTKIWQSKADLILLLVTRVASRRIRAVPSVRAGVYRMLHRPTGCCRKTVCRQYGHCERMDQMIH